MRLVDGCASAQVIRCPWHSWGYALDGRLLATPNVHGPDRQEPLASKSELGLKQIRCETWLDYVMVDISGNAPALERHLAPVQTQIEGFGLDDLVHEGRWDHSYPGNWKIAMEGAIEDYHVFWGHPQLLLKGKWRASETWGEVGVFAVTAGTGEITSAQGSAIGLPPIAVSGPLRNSVINIFPTGVIGIGPDHVMLGLMLPDGPDRTRISFDYYFHADAMGDAYAPLRRSGVKSGRRWPRRTSIMWRVSKRMPKSVIWPASQPASHQPGKGPCGFFNNQSRAPFRFLLEIY